MKYFIYKQIFYLYFSPNSKKKLNIKMQQENQTLKNKEPRISLPRIFGSAKKKQKRKVQPLHFIANTRNEKLSSLSNLFVPEKEESVTSQIAEQPKKPRFIFKANRSRKYSSLYFLGKDRSKIIKEEEKYRRERVKQVSKQKRKELYKLQFSEKFVDKVYSRKKKQVSKYQHSNPKTFENVINWNSSLNRILRKIGADRTPHRNYIAETGNLDWDEHMFELLYKPNYKKY